MGTRNIEQIIELQNERLQAAKKLSKSIDKNEEEHLRQQINNVGKEIASLNTKDPQAAKRLKKLLVDLPNVPTSCECINH